MLSKAELADFKNTMKNCFSIQMLSVDHCKLPENMHPVHDNPKIAILEKNGKVHVANIEQAQKLLDKMQTPAQIQKYKDYADSEYKKEFMRQLSDIHNWIDFFNGKNSKIYDFLVMLDTKSAMQKKLDDIVPQKDSKTYQARLDMFS